MKDNPRRWKIPLYERRAAIQNMLRMNPLLFGTELATRLFIKEGNKDDEYNK
jgi:hypothetical protein